MSDKKPLVTLFSALLLVAVFLINWFCFNSTDARDLRNRDIGVIWSEGHKVCAGENPYERSIQDRSHEDGADSKLSGELLNRAPIYLPGFYLLTCAMEMTGLNSFTTWVAAWNYIVLISYTIIGLIFFGEFFKRDYFLLALLVLLYWLFNRFGIHTLVSRQTNSLAILPLVLSLIWLDKRPKSALLLFGLSLAIKHVAIFLLPLYLIWSYRSEASVRAVARTALGILWLPIAITLPFLIWDAPAFFASMIYPLTRPAANRAYEGYPEFLFAWNPNLAFIVFLSAFGLVYLVALKTKLPRAITAFITMLVFVSFNATIFSQYFLWFVAMGPLALLEFVELSRQRVLPVGTDRVQA